MWMGHAGGFRALTWLVGEASAEAGLMMWKSHETPPLPPSTRPGLLKGAQLKGNAEVGPLPRHVRVSLLHTGKVACEAVCHGGHRPG